MPRRTSRGALAVVELDPEPRGAPDAAGFFPRLPSRDRARGERDSPPKPFPGWGTVVAAPPLERPPRVADADRQRLDPGEGEEPRRRRRQRRVGAPGPVEELARRTVEADPPRLDRDHPVGCRQAALQPVFGEQHRHPPLLVQPPQQPDQLVAGDRVELRGRLVEQHQPRPRHQRRRQRHPLQLAAGQGVDRAPEQVRDRQRQRHLLDRPGAVAGGVAAHLQRQLDLGGDGGRDDLRLGVLGDVADRRGELPRPGVDRVEPGHRRPAPRPRRRGSAGPGRRRRAAASTCPRPSARRAARTPPARPRARPRAAPAPRHADRSR